jgi:hypothetical protein
MVSEKINYLNTSIEGIKRNPILVRYSIGKLNPQLGLKTLSAYNNAALIFDTFNTTNRK